ncbi:ankyrin repeat domain-containing protein [Noviherbaspirillum pedocola]|uniref:Ankyrin repeat domain-containing protein n=1 Tax=Noviherbaspirillum pedocola TaxID=2801341 RepID=A0A934SUG0_9BURK|nr:ankyrin repeat domain-containing protein [Noviherbaspirillum pedocola]MBK4737011.1 ankyrin repeat domain-containing protein [Noviherbaspirillum pedocola]
MDATINDVSLNDTYSSSSSDESDLTATRKPLPPRIASSTSDTSLLNPANRAGTSVPFTAPGYVNPAPDFVDTLYEAGKLKQSERSQRKAEKLKERIPLGTLDLLFSYAASNDVDGIKKLIETGSINLHIPRVDDMRTPLMVAVIAGHVEMVQLLTAHAKPEQLMHRDESGASALDLALDHGTVLLADIVYKAAPGISHPKGYTPLVAAIAERMEIRISKLMKCVRNVNERSADRTTALEMAIQNGMMKLSAELLDKGAFVNEQDRERNCPLSFAARFGFGDIVALLCTRGANVDRQNKDGNTPLQFAAWGGHQLAVQRLLQHGADPNLQDNAGATPLYAAASCGNADIITILVEAQARVDLADIEDHTPLHMAAIAGHASAVKALIDAGASVDAVDKQGRTPLQYAVEKNRSDCARLLLEHEADVNHADATGYTALDIHDEHQGEEEVGRLLRDYRARGRCCKPRCAIV